MVKNLRLFLLSMVAMLGVTSAFAEDIIWQEDFSSFAANEVPTGGDYGYACVGSGTKIYNDALAGGTAPELLIGKNNGSFSVTIPLNGKSGDFVLSYMANYDRITVTSAQKDVTVGDKVKTGNTYELPVSIPAGTDQLILVFTNSNTSNVRFDNAKLYQGTAKKAAGLSWGTASRTVTIGADDNVFPTLSNTNNLAVTFASDSTQVATIDAEGNITLVAAGQTHISAAFAGNDEYEAQTVTYTLTVKGATTPDPEPDPEPQPSDVVKATCAEIIAGTDGTVFEVTGVCTKITNTTYGNWILTDATGEITVYGTLDAEGNTKNFASLGIEVGDTVTVQGPKATYKTTVELVNVTVLKIAKGKTEPVEVTTAANIGAFLALEAGAEAKLTLTDAQVTYVNVNNNKTDLFVRDATGAIDLYDLGIEATVGQLLNGTINVKLGANGGFVAAVKGTNELASTVVATAGGEVVAKTIDLAEAAAYYSDYVLFAGVTLNSEGKAENEDGDAVALYDRFNLGLIGGLKKDGTKYDLYGLMYDGGTSYGSELVVTKATLAGGGEIVDDPVTFTGDGTQANPYTVADLLQLNPDKIADYIAADAQVWVKGVIVGSINNSKLEETPSVASNIAIAAQAGETDFAAMVPVELKNNTQFRTKLNVVDNASNIGKEVLLCGNILKYFSKVGVKNLTDYVLDGQQLTTGINEVKTAERFQGAIYNVAGQRITTPAKGLYIMNGKKIVVK